MAIEFLNGTTVHELWDDLQEGTCLANCLYFNDAVNLAKARAKHSDPCVRYIIVDNYSGKSVVVSRSSQEPESDDE